MAEYKLSYTGKEIDEKLGKIDKISVGDTKPTDEEVEIWINTSEEYDDSDSGSSVNITAESIVDALGYTPANEIELAEKVDASDLGSLATKSTVEKTDLASTIQTSLNKADSALQSYTETDPTVPSWAKASTKPSYTKSEVGLGNVDNVKQYSTSNPPPYPVVSVNGKTGVVSLTASDVGARASTWMPTAANVGADASGTASSAVSVHNSDTAAHSDIREAISQLSSEKVDQSELRDEVLGIIAEIDSITAGVPLVEFSQENPVVAAYLVNVTYDPDDYSVSDVTSYANQVTEYRKDQPTGVQIQLSQSGVLSLYDGQGAWKRDADAGATTIYNATPGNVGVWFLDDGAIRNIGAIKPTGACRMLNLGDVQNTRDLGGWACDGGVVKYGKIFRGCALDDANGTIVDEENIKMMRNLLGVRHEIDFRTQSETGFKTVSVLGEDVQYDNFPVGGILNDYSLFTDLSGDYADEMRSILVSVFNDVKNNRPVFIHCSLGADRTGIVSFVLNGLLGVNQSDLDKDYELSSFGVENDVRRRNLYGYPALITYLNTFAGATMRDKIVAWAIELGLSVDDINVFRRSMINGTPEDIVVPAAYTNLADPTSADWLVNYRWSSSSGLVANNGTVVTNYIVCQPGDTVRIKGLVVDGTLATSGSSAGAVVFDADKNKIGSLLLWRSGGWSEASLTKNGDVYEYTAFTGESATTQQPGYENAAYLRFFANIPTGEVIITVNEPIE